MVDLGCQDTDWVGGWVWKILNAILLWDGFILATLSEDKGNVVILDSFLVGFEPWDGPLGSQMVDLGCQDTDWVGERFWKILDAILLWDGFILATLSMDKG